MQGSAVSVLPFAVFMARFFCCIHKTGCKVNAILSTIFFSNKFYEIIGRFLNILCVLLGRRELF